MFLSWDPASLLLRETARPRQAAGAEQVGQLNQLSLEVFILRTNGYLTRVGVWRHVGMDVNGHHVELGSKFSILR
jgi:hypothetical protein